MLPAQAAETDCHALIEQLGGPSHTVARDALLELGAPVAAELLGAVNERRNDDGTLLASRIFGVFRDMGPRASTSFEALVKLCQKVPADALRDYVETLADLALYFDRHTELPEADLLFVFVSASGRRDLLDPWPGETWQRMRTRFKFPRNVGIGRLRSALSGYRTYRIECALDVIAICPDRHRQLLPELCAIMNRRNPRLLESGGVVRLREKAANVILALGPEHRLAARAESVERGQHRPRSVSAVPGRLLARLNSLTDEMDAPLTRSVAIENLEALGEPAAMVLAAGLIAGGSAPDPLPVLLADHPEVSHLQAIEGGAGQPRLVRESIDSKIHDLAAAAMISIAPGDPRCIEAYGFRLGSDDDGKRADARRVLEGWSWSDNEDLVARAAGILRSR